MPSLTLENIDKVYDGGFQAIRDVSFSAEPGEFVVMVGPSGCGKSTLLRSIAGLETVSAGTIRINGRDITREEPSDRGVAMVFQNYALYPHMTVAENMGFALKIAGRPKAEIDAAVLQAAKTLRITEHLDKKPKALSGGQKQRVAIGRAITRSPDVFLFDEPLSNLDAALRTQMRIELSRLHASLKATMIYVTHDQTEAMTMADRIVVLNNGIIEQVGAPLELYNHPVNQFVAGFLGSPRMNFMTAHVATLDGSVAGLRIDGIDQPVSLDFDGGTAPAAGDTITLGIRPESLGHGDIVVPARIAMIESLGRETLIYLDGGSFKTSDSESQDGYFSAYVPSQTLADRSARMDIRIDPDALHVFDADGRILRHAR